MSTVRNDEGRCPHCSEVVDTDELEALHGRIEVDSVEAFAAGDTFITVNVVDEYGQTGTVQAYAPDISSFIDGSYHIDEEDVTWE